MAINPLVDHAASQQMAVVGNVNLAPQIEKLQKSQTQDQGAKSVEGRSLVKRVLEAYDSYQLGVDLLVELTMKVAESGIKLKLEKTKEKVKDEYDLMFRSGEPSEDSVDLFSATYRVMQKKEQERQNQQFKGQTKNLPLPDEEAMQAARDYTAVYAEYIIHGAGELKKKLEALEAKLAEKGVSSKDLLSLQQSVKTSVRAEITQQLKDAYLAKFLSPEKGMEGLIRNRSVTEILDFAAQSQALGGEDFGTAKGLQAVHDQVSAEAAGELKDFLKEEAEVKLVQQLLGTVKNPQKHKTELEDLLKLGAKMGLDLRQFTAGWQKKKNDLGLVLFNPPPPPSMLAAGGQPSFSSTSQEQKSGYELNLEDQTEILLNRMRAIYMVRAMRGDILTTIETAFKMRRLKNGLIKLGYSIGDFEKLKDQLKQEGETLARMRFLEMLREAYWERATLYELAGPAHTLIERKIKGILNNLERLGVKLGKSELEAIRDKTNQDMFDISLEELQTTSVAFKAHPNPGLEKKQLLLVKLLSRLKDESNLSVSIPLVESKGEKV